MHSTGSIRFTETVPESSHCPSLQTAAKIVCALIIIASIGAAVAGGVGWLPSYAVYAGIGGTIIGLIVLAALFYCTPDSESSSVPLFNPEQTVRLPRDRRPLLREQQPRRLHRQDFPESPRLLLSNPSSSTLPLQPYSISSPSQMEVIGNSRRLLIPFYRGEGKNVDGRTLEHILNKEDAWLEKEHKYIQWLFPLFEPTRNNESAPLLTQELLSEMKSDRMIKMNVLRAFDRMLAFYGLKREEEAIVRAENFRERRVWFTGENKHNFLRITRILNFMSLMGFEGEVLALRGQLRAIYDENPRHIPKKTARDYWEII